MNLCIDQGNTSTKVALFEHHKLCQTLVYKHFTPEDVRDIFQRFPIQSTIFSTVAYCPEEVLSALAEYSPFFIPLSTQTPTGIRNPYPDLGLDRLAAAVGANALFPNKTVLVVDAGTAITYDLVKDGAFVAGNIAAGLRMRIKALNQHTHLLPLIELSEKDDMPLLGTNVVTAIGAGVARGIAYEIEGYMRALTAEHGTIQTILTGGDSSLLMKYLSPNRSVLYEKDLTLLGLNLILERNLQ